MKAMSKRLRGVAFCFIHVFTMGMAVQAQTTNVFPLNGNVGIGTTNPAEQLDVLGGISAVGINLLPAVVSPSAWSPSAQGTGDGTITVVSVPYEGQTVNAVQVTSPQSGSWTFQRYFVNQHAFPPKARLTFTVYAKNDVTGAFRSGLSEGQQFGGAPTQIVDCSNTGLTTSDGLWTLYRSTMTVNAWTAINVYMGKDYNSIGTVKFAYPVLTVDSGVGKFPLGGFQIDQSTGAVYTASGYVGIGTANPGYPLDVTGQVNSSSGYCIAGNCITSWPTATSNAWNGTQTFTGSVNVGNNQTKIGYAGIPTFGGLNAGLPIFISNGGDGGNNQFFYDIYQNYEGLNFGAVNFSASGYGGVNPGSFSTLLQINGNGAIYTGRPQNTANSVTSNPNIVVSNTLDNGSGNMYVSGNVGIGTTNPQALLDIQPSTDGVTSLLLSQQNCVTCGWSMSAKDDGTFRLFRSDNPSSILSMLYNNGNVGIGTTAPAYKLDIAGQIHTSGSIVFSDNTTQSTAWTGSLCGGDYAESIDVSDDRKKYEPGDVLVIDPNNPGKFLKSAEPYSTMVMGIYSTKPGVVGRRQTTEKNSDEIPMAMIGIVPVKVSAENGPIAPGDLLVTSSVAGYAMKGTDHGRMLGAVLGKALGSLATGQGFIEVGVTLQ